MRDSSKFKLPDGHNEAQFMNKLAAQYEIKKEPAIVENFTLYDTFDWRLFNKSLVLYVSGKSCVYANWPKTKLYTAPKPPHYPFFYGSFPIMN